MRRALLTLLALTAAGALGGAAAPAGAKAKPKPITKSYTATAPVPSPIDAATGFCSGVLPMSFVDEAFKAPAAGRLTVSMDGFVGDWDLAIREDDSTSAQSGDSNSRLPNPSETISGFKLKRGQAVVIRSCNYSGGPTAAVRYTFVFS